MSPGRLSRCFVASGALLVAATFAACSSSDEQSPDGARDASVADRFEELDASPADGSDAPDARDADASDGRCTVDWCKTALPIPDGGKLTLMDVAAAAKDSAWAVSEEGLVLRWDGAAWSVVWDAQTPLYGVWVDRQRALWVVGAGGAIFRKLEGEDWTPIPSGLSTDLMDICEGTPDPLHERNLAIVATPSTVLRWTGGSGEGGNPAWEISDFGAMTELYSVSCAGSDIWVSGTNLDWFEGGGGLVFLNRGAGWLARHPASTSRLEAFYAIWARDEETLWVRSGGRILRSARTDGGADGDGAASSWAEYLSATSTRVKRPSAIWGAGANDVWTVTSHGRVHHWDGATFAITRTADDWDVLESNLHGVSGSSADDVWVVGDNVALHRNIRGSGKEGGR